MENRALQERVLEDIVFSLAKNHENFSFEKLSGLFPALSVDFIKKRFLLAKENLSLLDEIVSDTLENAQMSTGEGDYNTDILGLYNTYILTAITPKTFKFDIDGMTAITPDTLKF